MSASPHLREPGGLESLLFVVGHPLAHSLSPAMHGGVIARRGLPFRYVGVELRPGHLGAFLTAVRGANFLGGNVTIPYKEEAAALADVRSGEVEFCGAANVLVVRRGRLRAENTDGRGFMEALREAGWGSSFRRVVLLGAGGAARGIGYALGRGGTREMAILNRTPERGEKVAAALSARFPRLTIGAGRLDRRSMAQVFEGADLVVQCTSLGLTGEWKDFPFKSLQKGTRFADIVYSRGGTPLVRQLRRRGIEAMDGLPMLAHQASLSFAVWTGLEVPPEEFRRHAERALAGARGRSGRPSR